MQYLRYKPSRLWKLDTTAPYPDLSGYGVSAAHQLAQTNGISLSRYTAYSQVVNSTNYITFPQNVYKVGLEKQPFTLMANIYLPDTGGSSTQQILSNNGRTDGLAINGNTVTFGTAYASNGSATCSYTAPVRKLLNVAGVHTPTKNYLLVDGEVVDEIDITASQQADAYATTDGNLYAGKIASQNLLINMVAIYPTALRKEEIADIVEDANFVSETYPYSPYGGEHVDISVDTRKPFINPVFETDHDWSTGQFNGTYVANGVLRPISVSGYTTQGTWFGTINLYNADATDELVTAYMTWQGLNTTVSVSKDNSTWEDLQSGVPIALAQSLDPTGLSLTVRVTFDAGQDEAYIQNLEFFGFITDTFSQPNGRILTFGENSATYFEQEPYQLRSDWGNVLVTSDTFVIGQDTVSQLPLVPKSIEIWMRQTGSSAPTFSTNLTTGTTEYVNGVAGSTIRRGEWNVIHFTKGTTITGNITFTGVGQIGRVVLYENQLSATDISNIVKNYTGRLMLSRASGGSITVAEHNPAVNVYAHDWATTS